MPLTVLTLRTHDGEHRIACPLHSSLDLGSGPECEITLDGADVLPEHCVLYRTGEKCFQIIAAVAVARFTVNGVTGSELEVQVPFKLGIGGDLIEFDLVAEEDESLMSDEADIEVKANDATAGARTSRRDYLLQPTAIKPRAGEHVGEVLIGTMPAEPAVLLTIISADKGIEMPGETTAETNLESRSESESDEESSSLLLSGLMLCCLMIAAIIFWQRHLDQMSSPSDAVILSTSSVSHQTAEAKIRACEDLLQAGVPAIAASLLMPLAEEGHIAAVQPLAIALRDLGKFGGEVVFLMQQTVLGGNRAALVDFVKVIDHENNPARYAESSFKQLQQAAFLGETSAWLPLGERYEHGNGTVVDIKLALAAYEKAKAAGDSRAEGKLAAKQAAQDRAAAFIRSWNEVSVTTLLDHIAAAQGKFFMLDHAPIDALLRLEEDLRARWPLRRISVAAGTKCEIESFDLIKIEQAFQFEVKRGDRVARGKGVFACSVQRDNANVWRITDAEDKIYLTELLPTQEQFIRASSLRELKPAFTHEEQLEESRLEILHVMHDIEDTQDFKVPLTAIMNAVYEFPQEVFWKPFADKLCDRMARHFFAEGKWLDVTWAETVHQLAECGSVSAMLLEGHLLAAGYGIQRDEARSLALYQKAFEVGKRRDTRFYYAEALFQGRGTPPDFEKAGALVLSFMSRSKHLLEAYLAAHLLWRKAEIDTSLWQQVYDTLSRVTDKHPPAKNLAGMVLLNHGQTTKELRTGFNAIKAAAEAGVVEAMKTLASCYQEGIGCEKDSLTATTWKQKAAVAPPPRRKHYTEFGD